MAGQSAQVIAKSETLKSGWQQLKFGDVVRQVKDRVDPDTAGLGRYIAGEHMDTDDLRIHRWGEIGTNYLGPAFQMRFKPGQVLYGSRRTYLRKVAVPHFEGICANTTFVLESKNPKVLLPELLPFIMQTDRFNEHSVKQSKGSVNPYVNFSDLAWFEFALPSLEEQKDLLRLFKASNKNSECLQAAASSAFAVELAWLKNTFEDDNSSLFKRLCLADLLERQPESGVSAPPTASETGHWVLALNALSEVGYVPGQLKPVEPTESMLSALLRRGDLLISRSNTLERVGFVGIYNGESEGAVSYPDTMMRLSVRADLVLPQYLELYMQSPVARRQIASIAAGTSASMKKINKANLQTLAVLLPVLKVQQELVNVRKQICCGRLAVLARLKQNRDRHLMFVNHATSKSFV